MYKNITEFDIFGNGSQNTLGNGLTENTAYSNKSGQMLLKTIAKNNSNIMNIDYSAYDGFGNLKAVDITTGNIGNQHSFSETYDYDALHRLESNAVNGITTINYSYDAVGNLLSKSDYATQYDYENGATGGPNAVKRIHRSGSWKTFAYDARGNMAQGDGLTSASYNAMDKPTQIVKDGKTLNFTYGPQHMRFKQVNGSVTTFYSDKLYEEEVTGTKTTWRAYIDDIAVISQTTNEGATIRYTHRDRLGSARVFTDHNGQVEAERNYDPFGKPRLASGGLKLFWASKLNDLADAKTNRGYTDHEHLDSVELIHMNGRVYDYNLGRFMSVDPFVHEGSQGINPYSYIMNNPLSGIDPTGYSPEEPELEKVEYTEQTEKVAVTGSRIKREVVTGASGTATYSNGATQSFSATFSGGKVATMDIGSMKQTNANNTKSDPISNNIEQYAQENEYKTKSKISYSTLPIDKTNLDENVKPYDKVTLHHTGGADTPKKVEDMHRANEGIITIMRQAGDMVKLSQAYNNADVGYHFMISKDGTIYEGRSLEYSGAHVKGNNQGNIGIAFLGDYTENPISKRQFGAARQLIGNLRQRYKLSGQFIKTHGQFNPDKHNELQGAKHQVGMLRSEFK